MTQIQLRSRLTQRSRAAGSAPFAEIQAILRDLPQQFVGEVIRALAEATIEFVRQNPKAAETYRSTGFEVLWAGITRRR